jgi:hypothetical protein
MTKPQPEPPFDAVLQKMLATPPDSGKARDEVLFIRPVYPLSPTFAVSAPHDQNPFMAHTGASGSPLLGMPFARLHLPFCRYPTGL